MPIEPTWEETTAVEEPTWENTTEGETKSPGYLGPEWPAQEGEEPAQVAPTFPQEVLQGVPWTTRLRMSPVARAVLGPTSEEQAGMVGGLPGTQVAPVQLAEKALEATTPSAAMPWLTKVAANIPISPVNAALPVIAKAVGASEGVQKLAGIPTAVETGVKEAALGFPMAPLPGIKTRAGKAALAAFGVQFLASQPETLAAFKDAIKRGDYTEATKIVAGEVAMATGLAVGGKAAFAKAKPPPLPIEETIAKAEPILPQSAEAVRETKGTEDASEISKTAEVYGDVRPQPVEGVGQVPVEGSSAGVQPQAEGGISEAVTPPRPEAGQSRVLLDPIVAAAFRTPDGKIFDARTEGGVTHMEADMAARAAGEKVTEKDAGFVTQSGKFLTREEAYAHAEKTKQIISELDTFEKGKLHTGKMPSYEELTPEQELAEQRALDEALGQETTPHISQMSLTEVNEALDKVNADLKDLNKGYVTGKTKQAMSGPLKNTQTRLLVQKQLLEKKSTPLPKGTPTEPSAAEPSQLTPAQQGSIAQVSTPNVAAQATVAPFLDIPPEKWTPEYWKRIGDEGRRTVRSNLQGALQKLGSKTKITERSSPQAVFNAIAEVNKARTEPPPPLPPGPGAKTVGEPPYAAAQQLTDQLRATPPTGTKDAYTIRQKLADTWAQGKTIFERALGASRVTAETLKDTARGVRAITDLDRRVGELDWLLQKSAGQSRNLSKAIIAQQKSKTTREAIALWIDAGGDVQVLKDTLANLPANTRPNIRRALETAINLPPEARQFAQQIEQFYGIRLNDAREAEIFEKSLDDYFTHIWQKESNMPDKLRQAYSTGRVNDYFQFARQRKLPMFLDGILQGKTPELDPAKVLPYYNYALDRSIASRQFVKELSEVNAPDGRPAVLPTGTARRLEPNEEGVKGGIFINPKGKGEMGKDYHVIDHPAMRKWKWLGADEQGNPVMYRSDLAANPLVHERLARMLDQRLATPSKVGKALLRASTEVKGFKLGLLSAFHQVHVGSHALFHWTNPFKTGEIDWESPAVRYAVEKGHLKLAGDASQIAQFSEGLLSPGLVHKVPIIGPWSKAYSEWLFTDYIPRLKLKTFENALPRNLAWFSKDIAAGKITKEQVAARVGDAVNNAYGELNHWFLGKYGRSPQFQRILRGIFLAPDFGEARLRFVEKAFTKYGWEERMAFATMFLTLYAGARVANWLSHGDPETDLKNAFRVKVKIPGKDQMEWVSMRSVVGDLAHALTGFGQFMYVRLNPLYSRTISDILFQRDVYGRKLSFGDIAFKRPAQQLVPINFTGLTREDQSLWESAVTSAGLQVQHDVPAMDIGKLKRKWLLSNPDPKLRSMGEKNEASLFPPSDYSPLRRALASGDLKQAGAEYDALLTEKKKKHSDIVDALTWYTGGKEVNGVYHERKIKPIGGQIGVDAEKKFLASLTPAERRLYAQALEERKRIYGKFLELMKSR